jgi:prophage regulatory protein
MERFIKVSAVQEILGLGGRQSVYDQVAQRTLCAPVKVGRRASAWILSELEAIVAARVAGEPDDQIQALVLELEQRRSLARDALHSPNTLHQKARRAPGRRKGDRATPSAVAAA